MFKTIVTCSMSDCDAPAECKIAAPWSYDRFSELKTYAFACDAHADDLLHAAERRPKPRHLATGEQVGPIAKYELPLR